MTGDYDQILIDVFTSTLNNDEKPFGNIYMYILAYMVSCDVEGMRNPEDKINKYINLIK